MHRTGGGPGRCKASVCRGDKAPIVQSTTLTIPMRRRSSFHMRAFMLLSLHFALHRLPSAAQDIDQNWWVTDGTVATVATDTANGVVYIGGNFDNVAPHVQFGAQLTVTNDQPAVGFAKPNGEIYAVVPDGLGGWYLGGTFTEVAGQSRNRLARINADGSVHPWNPSTDYDVVYTIVLDGTTIYIGGEFTTVNGQSRANLAAVDYITGVLLAWNPAPNGPVHCLVASDSVIYVGGEFTSIGGELRNHIAAVDKVYGTIENWNPNASNNVDAIAVHDTSVYLGGEFTYIGGQSRDYIAAVGLITGLATPWNPNANGPAYAFAFSGSSVYIGGYFSNVGGQTRVSVAKIDLSTGALDGWNAGISNWNGLSVVRSLSMHGSDVIIGGGFDTVGSQSRDNLASVDTTSALATAWNPSPNRLIRAMALTDSSLYVGGGFSFFSSTALPRNNLAAFDWVSGSPTAWNPGTNGGVMSIALGGGYVYVGGSFSSIGGQSRNDIAQLDGLSGAVNSWNPNPNNYVSKVVVRGANVYVAGRFTAIGGQSRYRLAALDAITGNATVWNANLVGSGISTIIPTDYAIFVGGSFTNIGGQSRNNIGALDVSTGSATAWNPNANGNVAELSISGQTVYAAGGFTNVGGQLRNRLAALDIATGLPLGWNPNADDGVSAMEVIGNVVYVAGAFQYIGGEYRLHLASVDGVTGAASTWNPSAWPSPIESLFYDGHHLHVAGDFDIIGMDRRSGYAAFSVSPISPASYAISAACHPEGETVPLVELGTMPVRICADGSAVTVLTVTTSDTLADFGDVQFRLVGATADVGYSGALSNPDSLTPVSKSTRLTHPTYINVGAAEYREDTIEVFNVNDTNTVLAWLPVRFYRTPIAFIHGFYGQQSTFETMCNDLLLFDRYPADWSLASGSPLLWRADYSATSTQRFLANRKVVKNAIDSVIVQAIENGYSCGKAAVVGHSMGGVLSRLYLQSLNNVTYRNDMNRLITLNTPHYGTQLVNYCATFPAPPVPSLCNWGYSLLGLVGGELGAVKDLGVDSDPIERLNSFPQIPTIPCATWSSDQVGDQDGLGQALRLGFLYAFSPLGHNIYDSEAHDLVVPLSSQQSGMGLYAPVEEQWHIGSARNVDNLDAIQNILDVDPTGPSYSQTGFPQGSLTYASGSQADHVRAGSKGMDQAEILNPMDGTSFAPSEIVTVEISSSPNITDLVLFVTGSSVSPITIDTVITSQITEVSFQVPANAIGTLDLFVLGGDGSDWTASDDGFITIASTVVPDSIQCAPQVVSLPLGIAQHIQTNGYFGSAMPTSLYGTAALNIVYDSGYLMHDGGGNFQSLSVGTTTVVFEYLGMTDTVLISIADDPNALVAAFDYTEDDVCAGSMVEFEDQSQGLVTGREWSFPGGSPSTSTMANPIVTYSVPGSFSVTLITTFVNGSDTLVMNALVEVAAPLDLSVTNGSTLIASATADAYQWLYCDNAFVPIVGATDQEYFPGANGNYAVIVTEGFCSDTSACQLYLSTGLMPHSSQTGISVQPNPTEGMLLVRLPAMANTVKIEITDVADRVVFVRLFSNAQSIPVELNEPAGVYIVKVSCAEWETGFRVVKM